MRIAFVAIVESLNLMRNNRFEGVDNKRIKDRFAKRFDIQYRMKKKTGHLIRKWQGQSVP